MRRKPTYLTTVVGIPPQEDVYLGKASERIFLPMIRKTLPEIVDMHFPPEGIFHNIVLVSIDKRYPGHARKVMNAFWGLGQLMFSKTIIVVDKDVDVQNVSEVAWIAGTHVDPQRDIQFTVGPMDDLENASSLPAFGSKMGIDATRKWPGEGFTREWPTRLTTTEAASRKASDLLKSIAEGHMMAASLDDLTSKVEAGERLSDEDIAALGSSRDIIMLGMLASIVRRKLHGTDVTYVRVADLKVESKTGSGGVFVQNPGKPLPTPFSAGEFRIFHTPHTLNDCIEVVAKARELAGTTPLSAFCLYELSKLPEGLPVVLAAMKKEGLEMVAQAPFDRLADPERMLEALTDAGLTAGPSDDERNART